MERSIGPRYLGTPVFLLEDDFIVDEINRLRRQGLDAMAEFMSIPELMSYSPEGCGDAAARKSEQIDYRQLWNEFIRRAMLGPMREPLGDGGWGDG